MTSIPALIDLVAILPFFLFSATAGQIADKYEKATIIRYVKLFEIAIMLTGAVGFFQGNLLLLISALFLMGLHSTIFGPVKYSILPQHLQADEIVGGNGVVEMGTFLAILIGTIAGGLLVAGEYQQAARIFEQMLAQPGLPDGVRVNALFRIAIAYGALKDLKAARAAINQALQLIDFRFVKVTTILMPNYKVC